MVISQIQVGSPTSASHEFIELHNNSSDSIDITDWCLQYISATQSQSVTKLACFTPSDPSFHLLLPAAASVFAMSTQLAASSPAPGSNLQFGATLSGSAGHVRLVDSSGVSVDTIGWGAAAALSEGGAPAGAPTTGKILQRKAIGSDAWQDTNNNAADIELATARPSYAFGAIVEVQDLCLNQAGIQTTVPTDYQRDTSGNCALVPVDVCVNLDGLQVAMPPGYQLDSTGSCQLDACLNITGLQLVAPIDKERNLAGDCVDLDVCSNFDGPQASLPSGYRISSGSTCLPILLPIQVSELLPNPDGNDADQEFIELYNPNDESVELSSFVLAVGGGSPKLYPLSADMGVPARGYVVLYHSDLAFTLVNSSSRVQLLGADGAVVDEPPGYIGPDDGVAWALIGGVWQYTNQPTPGSANRGSIIEDDEVEMVSGLKSCAVNQFRSPDTNRCRLLQTVGSTLTPCRDGQYRSEETNRCRSIASDAGSFVPCQAGQERNPDTNRCRQLASIDTALAPCKAGQERNPETNRCRNVTTGVPEAAFAVEPVGGGAASMLGWWALGSIGVVALGYAGWEWRMELTTGLKRLRSLLPGRK